MDLKLIFSEPLSDSEKWQKIREYIESGAFVSLDEVGDFLQAVRQNLGLGIVGLAHIESWWQIAQGQMSPQKDYYEDGDRMGLFWQGLAQIQQYNLGAAMDTLNDLKDLEGGDLYVLLKAESLMSLGYEVLAVEQLQDIDLEKLPLVQKYRVHRLAAHAQLAEALPVFIDALNDHVDSECFFSAELEMDALFASYFLDKPDINNRRNHRSRIKNLGRKLKSLNFSKMSDILDSLIFARSRDTTLHKPLLNIIDSMAGSHFLRHFQMLSSLLCRWAAHHGQPGLCRDVAFRAKAHFERLEAPLPDNVRAELWGHPSTVRGIIAEALEYLLERRAPKRSTETVFQALFGKKTAAATPAQVRQIEPLYQYFTENEKSGFNLEYNRKTYIVSGILDERADLSIMRDDPGPLKINLKRLFAINSTGVRSLVQAIKGKEVEYQYCPPTFVDLLNIVPLLLPKEATVHSLYMPMVCPHCGNHENAFLVENDWQSENLERPCKVCSAHLNAIRPPGDFLAFHFDRFDREA